MSDTIQCRLADHSDTGIIIAFQRAMARETEDRVLPGEVVSSGVSAVMDRPGLGYYVIATVDDNIAGSLLVTREWSDWRDGYFWWVQSVYVKPEYRRKGVYGRLYDYVKKRAAAESNVIGFRLYVEKKNVAAQKAYEKLGMYETQYKMYEDTRSCFQ